MLTHVREKNKVSDEPQLSDVELAKIDVIEKELARRRMCTQVLLGLREQQDARAIVISHASSEDPSRG